MTADEVYYDPWDADLNADPYPMFRRLRESAPLYYNAKHDFYALSRFDDVNRALVDHQAFSSARGVVLEIIKAGIEIPPGVVIFEDPPIHDIHRSLLSRAFTPRKISALEPRIREFTQRCLDPLIGGDRLDFVKDLGAIMPLRVVGMLFGIPEDYQRRVQEHADKHVRTGRGGRMTDNRAAKLSDGEVFADFIDWRTDHPADDLTTELLNAEFQDERGATRKLHRDELLMFMKVVAVAGSETTTRLIGWSGKLLSEHPEQRRRLVGTDHCCPARSKKFCASSHPRSKRPGTSLAMSNFTGLPSPREARS